MKIEHYRPLLFSVAYNMLGQVQEAEDCVQDAMVKVLNKDQHEIQNLKSYLTRTVVNLSINRYHKLKQQREYYTGEWLPEPVIQQPDNEDGQETHQLLKTGMLKLLEKLNPVERAVFLMREVWQYEFETLGQWLEKSPANCRKILSRAKEKIENPDFKWTEASEKAFNTLFTAFQASIEEEDPEKLKSLLAHDITLYADAGGKKAAAIKPVFQSQNVAKFLIGIRKNYQDVDYKFIYANGQPAVAIYTEGELDGISTFDIDENGRINNIYIVRNPDKLSQMDVF